MDDEEMKMGRDSTTLALLSINNLKYSLPEQLSIVTARSVHKFPSLNQSHEGGRDTVYFRIETGQRYIDGRNSWIRLRLEAKDAGATTNFGSGSIAKLYSLWSNSVGVGN